MLLRYSTSTLYGQLPVGQTKKFGLRLLSSTSSSSSTKKTATAATTLSFKEKLQCYDKLSKSRLSGLVVMTTAAGFLIAGGPIDWTSLASVCVGTSFAACSANTFNQIYEIDKDKLMNRTKMRPLPSGKVTKTAAIQWGVGTAALSTGILAVGCNPLTAGLGLFNIGLYAGVYTPMKQFSELNTWMGSIVGAIPPLMGYAAATGTIFAPEALLAASTLFLWQFPHFFALSWRLRKDYARGGFKMVPCADPTGARTSKLVMKYAAYLAPLPIIASMTGVTSYMFALEGTAINAYTMYLASKFYKNPTDGNAKKIFLQSLWYLPALLGFMVYHSKNWNEEDIEKHKDKTNMISNFIVDGVAEAREGFKNVCVHERLWGSNEKEEIRDTQTNPFCPVKAADSATTSIAVTAESNIPTNELGK